MNVLEDPLPYSANDTDAFAAYCDYEEDNFASVDIENKELHCITTKVHYIPNISIPTIPDKILILSENNFMEWTNNIPLNLKLNDKFYFTIDNKTESIYSYISKPDEFKNILWGKDKKIYSIEIYITYKLKLDSSKSIAECLTINQSVGENDTFNNIILSQSYPRLTTRRTLQERNTARRQILNPELILQQTQNSSTRVSSSFNLLLNSLIGNTFQLQEDYNSQNNTLVNMGFTNTALNRTILRRTMGNVDAAVEYLVSQDI